MSTRFQTVQHAIDDVRPKLGEIHRCTSHPGSQSMVIPWCVHFNRYSSLLSIQGVGSERPTDRVSENTSHSCTLPYPSRASNHLICSSWVLINKTTAVHSNVKLALPSSPQYGSLLSLTWYPPRVPRSADRDFPSVYLAPFSGCLSIFLHIASAQNWVYEDSSLDQVPPRTQPFCGVYYLEQTCKRWFQLSNRCYRPIFRVSNLYVVSHSSVSPIQRQRYVKVYGIWQADSKTDVNWNWIWMVTVRSRQTLFIRCDTMTAELFKASS